MENVFSGLFSGFVPIISFLINTFIFLVIGSFVFLIVFFIYFFKLIKINPFTAFKKNHCVRSLIKLRSCKIKNKYVDLFRWCFLDFITRNKRKGEFKEYGFSYFVGRQGTGKTISMVNYLHSMRLKYPNCIIVTNFKCAYADFRMKDWRDLLNVRNGTNGVIFAIDEIQNEYSSASWKDVPETILAEISQQRKQRIKIVTTTQRYGRVAKPLREQSFTVIVCKSLFGGRLTQNIEYDADLYSVSIENNSSAKLKPFRKFSFVQSDQLRRSYDTYEKIVAMRKVDFIPRHQR